MKKINLKLLIITGLLTFMTVFVYSQVPEGDQNWEEILYDHFSGSSLNTEIWTYHPWGNNSNWDYYWDESAVTVNNSNLIITSTLDTVLSRIKTGGIRTIEPYGYGYYEASMKIDLTGSDYQSTWNNAFWLHRGSDYYHPCCYWWDPTCSPQKVWWDEIDIEVLRNYNLTSNVHLVYGQCENNYEPGIFEYPLDPYYLNTYQTYGIEYFPGNIKFFLDNNLWDERILEGNGIHLDSTVWISFMTGFLYWYGNYSNIHNGFPGYIYVDWVKYKQLITTYCENDATIYTNSDLANFQYGVRRNITIGDGDNSISLSTGNQITFRATNEVIINGDFTVPVGAELNIIPTTCN